MRNEKQLWEHVGPAPLSPWSEKLRMDALLDGMRRGHSVPGSCVHVEGSHTNTHDLCPGLSGWSGLAWPPSVRPPHRTRDSALALGSVGGPEPYYTGLLPLGARGQAHVCASWALVRASSGVLEPESGVLSVSSIGYGRVRGPSGLRVVSPLSLGSVHTCSTACDVHRLGRGHAEQPHPPHNELVGLK